MGEGLSAVEVGHEIAHHAKHSGRGDHRDRWISIAEALLLSVVTLAAAWSGYSAATRPFSNADAPAGPQAMPQYVPEGDAAARHLDDEATALYDHGEHAAETGDEYVRVTVILASVLFLVGVSTQFPLRGGRYALVGLGAVLLIISFVQLLQLPGPPT